MKRLLMTLCDLSNMANWVSKAAAHILTFQDLVSLEYVKGGNRQSYYMYSVDDYVP